MSPLDVILRDDEDDAPGIRAADLGEVVLGLEVDDDPCVRPRAGRAAVMPCGDPLTLVVGQRARLAADLGLTA